MAELQHEDPLLATYPEAQFFVRVQADRIYPSISPFSS